MLDRYFDELQVGEVFEATRGRTITEVDLALFSAAGTKSTLTSIRPHRCGADASHR